MHREERKAHKRRLKLLQIKAAFLGIDCHPHILMEIEDIALLLKKENLSGIETFD